MAFYFRFIPYNALALLMQHSEDRQRFFRGFTLVVLNMSPTHRNSIKFSPSLKKREPRLLSRLKMRLWLLRLLLRSRWVSGSGLWLVMDPRRALANNFPFRIDQCVLDL